MAKREQTQDKSQPQDQRAKELAKFFDILAVKEFRIHTTLPSRVPRIPCLDHEARLYAFHEPHVSFYLVPKRNSGHIPILEAAFYLSRNIWIIDHDPEKPRRTGGARSDLANTLEKIFPGDKVVLGALPSIFSAQPRVCEVAEAQLTLKEVLTGRDMVGCRKKMERLAGITEIIEKKSRVSSWGIRTASPPVIAAAAALIYVGNTQLGKIISPAALELLTRSLVVGLGMIFLYFGMKAVQLTSVSTRLSKKLQEYSFILAERQRIGAGKK